MSRVRAASLPAWMTADRIQARRSGVSAVAVEVIVNNAA
jgi:hypothetical protein